MSGGWDPTVGLVSLWGEEETRANPEHGLTSRGKPASAGGGHGAQGDGQTLPVACGGPKAIVGQTFKHQGQTWVRNNLELQLKFRKEMRERKDGEQGPRTSSEVCGGAVGAGAPERRGRLHHPRPEEAAQPLFQNSLEEAFLMEETAWVSCRSDGPLGKSRGITSKTQPRKATFHRRQWSSGGWNSMRGQESLSPASCSRHTQLATGAHQHLRQAPRTTEGRPTCRGTPGTASCGFVRKRCPQRSVA